MVYNIFKKQFIDTKNLFFFIPMLFILLTIYIIGYLNSTGTWDGISFFECLKVAMDGFKFEIKRVYVEDLMKNDIFYAIDVYWATVLAGITLFSAIAGLFKVAIMNFFSLTFRRFKTLDIVIGDKENCEKYAAKHKNSVYWVEQKLTTEEKKKLFVSGVTYINRPLMGKKVARFAMFAKKTINIICFQKDGQYLQSILKLIKDIPENNKEYRISVQAEEDIISFVDDELADITKDRKNILAIAFDLYELVARSFNQQYNLAMFLPRGTIDENYLVKPEYQINVVMLGFGKTAYALYRGLMLNNQFVHLNKKTNKYETHQVNYYLYDKDEKAFKKPVVAFSESFEKLRDKYINKNALEPLELPGHVAYQKLNFKADVSDEFLKRFSNDENSFTYFFVCSSSSVDNAAIAKSIARLTNKDRTVIFYNDDSDNNKYSIINDANIHPFGFKNKMFKHDSICNDSLWEIAKDSHQKYMQRKDTPKEVSFNELFLQEKLSNTYRSVNMLFKLNCLGYYVDNNSENAVTIEQINKRINPEENYTYEDHFKISLRTAMAYQEHNRWNMSYFLSGYRTMPLEEIKYENNVLIHKNHTAKKHACLVSYYALDKLIKYEEKLTGKNQDCIIYDYLAFDKDEKKSELYKNITARGLYIHER